MKKSYEITKRQNQNIKVTEIAKQVENHLNEITKITQKITKITEITKKFTKNTKK